MLSSWEHAESHKQFLNLSELIQILVYFITLCPGWPCSWFGRPISNQPTGQNYELFDLKIQIYYTHFPFIFYKSCQIYCVLHTFAAIPKMLKYLSCIFAFNRNSDISTQQNRGNEYNRSEFSDQKFHNSGL